MNRRHFLRVAAAVPAGSFLLSSGTKAQSEKPNMVVILVDDLGYGDLSSYGASDLKTPNIDNLIQSGLRFDNFYANCPVCSPTRASLLSGRYPDMVGVPGVIRTHWTDSWGYLADDAVLLPQALTKAGYFTAIIGKWHLGLESPNTPTERGFDFFRGFLGDMMDDYYTHRRHGYNYMRHNRAEIDPQGHATDLFSQWAVEFINEQKRKANPFFLYLAYNAPHTPIQPPEEWLQKVKAREKGIDEKRARLVALIEHLDDGIGRVLKALRQTGLDKNTLIVFTSDNGGQGNVGANNDELRGAKQDMYEGGIKVPAAFVWPGKITPGQRTNRIALAMDIFPTLCRAAGFSVDHPIDGMDLSPTLMGAEQDTSDRSLVWVRREGGRYEGRAYYAIRKGPWKLLQNSPFEPMRLYNLEEDPLEQNPLGKEHPMYKELERELRKHIIKAGAIPWHRQGTE